MLFIVGLFIAVSSHAQPSFLTNGLVAYYPFNGNANDASGNKNNGTIYGGVVLVPDRFGRANSAYLFDGTDGYIDVGNPVGNSPTYLTESAWVNILTREPESSGTPHDVIITKRQVVSDSWAGLAVVAYGANTGKGEIMVDGESHLTEIIGVSQIPTNQWLFICGVKSNGVYQIYVNGTLENTGSDGYSISSGDDMYLMHEGAWGTYCNGILDDVRIYNRALSSNEVAQLYAYESIANPPTTKTAAATATLVNSFVIGVSIVDGGYGYTNTPNVRFIGGGGSGAQAVAVVSNGVVTAVNVMNTGSGYTNAPVVVIDPPFILNPALGIVPVTGLVFSSLIVGNAYQLQQSVAWYWTNLSSIFTASNALFTNIVGGAGAGGDYRLAINPVPAQAFATPDVVYGFVVHATVTSGGSGYVTSPAVSIVGGGGSGATAVSQISGGVVTNISITSAGAGYTGTPTVQIGQPPTAAVFPTMQPVMRVDASSLAPYDNYQIQYTPAIGGTWENWNGGLFSPTAQTNSQFIFITNNVGFFQLQYVP